MYQINITRTAEIDLSEAALYIADNLGNKAAADRFLDKAEKEILSLSEFPERNSLVCDSFLAANGIRMHMIDKYLAFYIIRPETNSITVIRVIHSRRDWINILKVDTN